MQVVLVYFQPFRRNSVLKCALHTKIAKKFTKDPFLGVQGRSRSSKKPVASACYDKQHVCIYLQPFSHYTSQ